MVTKGATARAIHTNPLETLPRADYRFPLRTRPLKKISLALPILPNMLGALRVDVHDITPLLHFSLFYPLTTCYDVYEPHDS